MFKSTIAATLLMCATLPAAAQDSSQLATVYFLRASGNSVWGPVRAFIDDSLVCLINNNRYSVHYLSPGVHSFGATLNASKPNKKRRRMEITLLAGGKYYVMPDVLSRAYWSELSIIEVTENTARNMLTRLKEERDCSR